MSKLSKARGTLIATTVTRIVGLLREHEVYHGHWAGGR